jgi:hypothetical protein
MSNPRSPTPQTAKPASRNQTDPPLLAILLLATALRFYRLDSSSLWSDEGNTWAQMARSIGQIASSAAADIHPPGYYWLLKLWSELTGASAFALRSFSALAGVLLVCLIYAIARCAFVRADALSSVFAPWLALLAGLLAALHPFQIYYSQEARMYTVLALESAGLLWATLVLSEPAQRTSARWTPLGVYALSATAGLWTHYSFPFVLLAAWLYWLTQQRRQLFSQWRTTLAPWLALHALVLLGYLPWLATAINRVLIWPGGTTLPLSHGLPRLLQTLLLGPLRQMPTPLWPWLAFCVLAPALGWAALARSKGKGAGYALLTWLALPIVLMLALGLLREAYFKFLLVTTPAWVILSAASLYWVKALRWPQTTGQQIVITASAFGSAGLALLLGAWLALPNYYFDPFARDNYAGMARYVAALGDPDRDVVVLDGPGQQEVWRYYDPGLPTLALPAPGANDASQAAAALEQWIGQTQPEVDRRQIFALFWGVDEQDPDHVVERWLDERTFKGLESWQGHVRFVTYGTAATLTCLPLTPALRFGLPSLDQTPVIELRQQCQPAFPQRVMAGQMALWRLVWQASAPIAGRYKISVQLLDARNQVIAQHDSEPGGGSLPTDTWLPGQAISDNHAVVIPPGTPPGDYRVAVAIYDPDNSQRLVIAERANTADGDNAGSDALNLGAIDIERPVRPLPIEVVPMQQRLQRQLGVVRLVGYDLYKRGFAHDPAQPLAPGDLLHVVFYWQAPKPLPDNWPSDLGFTLQLGAATLTAPLLGQGHLPTGAWQPGDLLRSEFDLPYDGNSRTLRLSIGTENLWIKIP